MHATTNRPDSSSDAGASAAGLAGQQAFREQQAFDVSSPTYDATHNVIANNASGGAGYFAEAHHTASLNIDANANGLGSSAERIGSTAFGSPDIIVDGEQFNPKFYQTAQESYKAGAQMLGDGPEVVAKYAGQTIIVPSDQLSQAQHLHSEAITSAQALGDIPRVQALVSIQYADHIDHGGAQSIPLSYQEAQAGSQGIRDGVLPGYAGSDTTLLGDGAEGALLAASIALATSIGPQLIGDVADTVRGKLTRAELAARLHTSLTEKQTRITAGWALSRGGAAAAMTAVDAIDPFGAALLANLLIDLIKLGQSVQSGAIAPDQFGVQFLEQAKSRMGYTALTAGAFWVMGPVGLLAPIIVKRMVRDSEMQRQTLHAWRETGSAFRAEFESRVRGVAMVFEIEQYYRRADASTKASATASKAIAQDVAQIIKLVGYRPSRPEQAGT